MSEEQDKASGCRATLTIVEDTERVRVPVRRSRPGIIIFVHGVNSIGEWYDDCEAGLLVGLGTRLRLGGPILRDRSPVIPFYWGYSNPAGKRYKIPLARSAQEQGRSHQQRGTEKELRGSDGVWGGGPFQNGTGNPLELWSKGFNSAIARNLNPLPDRYLGSCPDRTYMAHAALRLAQLIDTARGFSPQDALTIISHSQGTIITIAAMFFVKTRCPDTVLLNNSPYRFTSLGLYDQGPLLDHGDRLLLFREFVERVARSRDGAPDAASIDRLRSRFAGPGWGTGSPGERNNYGLVFSNFCPHDRVIGARPVQGIGWRGISEAELAKLPPTVRQRVFAARWTTGAAHEGGRYRLRREGEPFWDIPPEEAAWGWDILATPGEDAWAPIKADPVPAPIALTEAFDEKLEDIESCEQERERKQWLDLVMKQELYRVRQIETGRVDEWGTRETRPETPQEVRARLENLRPAASNHSTFLRHRQAVAQVLAYDVAVGECRIGDHPSMWRELRQLADWACSDDYYATAQLPEDAIAAARQVLRKIVPEPTTMAAY